MQKKQQIGKIIPQLQAFIFIVTLSLLFITSCSEGIDDSISENMTGNLTLLPDPGELISIEGTTNELTTGRATSAAGIDNGRFNISLKYIVPATDNQKAVFDAAAARWERIIIQDVPSFTGTVPSAFAGFPPAIDGTVDDIVIEVALAPIDGPGGILGQAGPRFVRTSDFLTLTGVMFFDVDDLAFLERLDLFEEVIVHEMGHVLGVGTLWNFRRELRKGALDNPYFAGEKANVFWNAEGGEFELPVENIGGPGTALSHWREFSLNNELMTGFLNLGENPLSRITAGSMQDLGYGIGTVGESYELPRGTEGVDIETLVSEGSEYGLHIGAMEILLEPIGVVSSAND